LQYEYNLSVVNTSAELEEWDEVKDHLTSGIKDLFERNKVIKLVDRSESGWVFAEEYLNHEVAENEEDARKIKRAEASAAIKKKKYTDQRGKGRFNGGYDRNQSYDRRSSYDDRNDRRNSNGGHQYYDRSNDNRRDRGSDGSARYGRNSDRVIACYHCKGPHMRSECEEYKEFLKKQRNN
jgi:hypothetical protein